MGGAVDALKDQEALQGDVDGLECGTIINSMKLNENKCWTLHLGYSSTFQKYKFQEEWLGSSTTEMGLGMLADSRLKVSSGKPSNTAQPAGQKE